MRLLGVGILSRWKQTPVSWLVGAEMVLVLSAAGAWLSLSGWVRIKLAIGSLLLLVFLGVRRLAA
ncbi:hypothetical protein ULG90_08785 [Halopseudomonas pachastrellae]|nr:hypothetical protein ULG90_08785 [Halopseudomonas pachastrellae]